MARPAKLNAAYFSHDVGMRDDVKIKAVRRKFGHEGYSIWIMLLEFLANSDYFEYKWDDTSIELLCPDFDIEVDRFKEIMAYLRKLDLIQFSDNGYIHCEKLTQRLMDTLIKKRDGFSIGNAQRSNVNI